MEKGLIHIYTGHGKGKTTASVGLAVRARGRGLKVLFAQFFKEESAPSGEKEVFSTLGPDFKHIYANIRHPFFTGKATDEAAVAKAVNDTFKMVTELAVEEGYDLLVMDEVISAVKGGWIALEKMLGFLEGRPEGLEVVLTGRDAPMELMQVADYVTEMLKIKHPFDGGIPARDGIEF